MQSTQTRKWATSMSSSRKVNAVAILFFCILSNTASAQQKIGNTITAVQKGECSVQLNSIDIGCSSSAVHSQLENGRQMIDFPTNDIATIGFVGNRFEVTDAKSSVLWVDAAYINQQRVEADGQCEFEKSVDAGVTLQCKAVLRDGRKLSAFLKSAKQNETFLGLETKDDPVTKEITDYSCDELWFGRNKIFKEAGYCFKLPRAVAAFGNAGCRYDDINAVRLTPEVRNFADAIQRAERAKACPR